MQFPPLQKSATVQKSPSSQVPDPGTNVSVHSPDSGSQAFAVHGLPSSQSMGVAMQPVSATQLSRVQGFPSSHAMAAPWHGPPAIDWQKSFDVQGS
ncbi:MAG TPA: hypothetical protein VFW45_02715 [Candidatus Polarisedimenticolia bacterium]|nr:hypothetical protein [Candidatus Polarisedimenticolia bacterium]